MHPVRVGRRQRCGSACEKAAKAAIVVVSDTFPHNLRALVLQERATRKTRYLSRQKNAHHRRTRHPLGLRRVSQWSRKTRSRTRRQKNFFPTLYRRDKKEKHTLRVFEKSRARRTLIGRGAVPTRTRATLPLLTAQFRRRARMRARPREALPPVPSHALRSARFARMRSGGKQSRVLVGRPAADAWE